jgi:hypothetical protein
MRWRGLWLFVVLLMSAPMVSAASAKPSVRPIYGLHEQVYISDLNVVLPAKVDTGADSSSLSATNIKWFKRGGESWVRFDLAVNGMELNDIELPRSHNVRIRRRAADYDQGEEPDYARRPVVELTLCIANQAVTVDVNLADRRGFRQPVLIGASALRKMRALVDPDIEFSAGVPLCKGTDDAMRYPPLNDEEN